MAKSMQTAWDLSPLLPMNGEKGFTAEREKVEKANYAFINKWKDRTDYLEDPKVLREALDEYEVIEKTYSNDGSEGYYWTLRGELDTTDTDIKAKDTKIGDFAKKISNDMQFFIIRLAKVDEATQRKFLSSPDLSIYTHFLERLFVERKYILSEPEEKIMTLKSKASYADWVTMTTTFISKSEEKILGEDGEKKLRTFEEISTLTSSQNKRVRDDAAKAFNKITDKYKEVAESEINAILGNKKVDDELRGYTRPDEAKHVADDIDTSVVDAMLDAVSSENNIAQRYYTLKARLMGVKKLAYHERNVPYGKEDKDYTFEEAVELVKKVFRGLDPEFEKILQRFLEDGQIDVFPKKGKRGGAFCIDYLLSMPTYVFLNFTNKLRDVETIAHEMGHAIHAELMRGQHALYFGTTLAVAEVSSTFMEDFVTDELMKSADDELRLSLMMNKLNGDISTIFRQVACYRFEQELHKSFREKGYLSYKEIGEIFQKHMSAYMGPSVELSKGSENWWVYWSHIRRFFYVYSYASGLLISKSMQSGVKKDPKFIEKVKEFFAAGLSASPKDIFAKMDIDITDKKFWEKGVQEVADLLDETEALAKKLGKI